MDRNSRPYWNFQVWVKQGATIPVPAAAEKKYKKCHLAADEDFEFWEKEELSLGDREDEASREIHKVFYSTDFEVKAGIVRNFLTGNTPPDAESIQYCFDDLWAEAETPRQYEVCGELVQLLQDRHGGIFDEIEGGLLDECVQDAVVDGL